MREEILFNEEWLFHRGDIIIETPREKGPLYMNAKTERMKWGPACKDYHAAVDDFSFDNEIKSELWERVTLPHDYVIEQEPQKCENNALGYFKYENAWYRKEFFIDGSDKGKRITILFEGVATNATVYLNGCLMKHNFCGYTSFEVDISDMVKFNEKNVIAVYVSTDNHEGWWYEGGGIYRNVRLIKTSPVCVDLWGVFAAPQKITESDWLVNTEVTVVNDLYEDTNAEIICSFYNADGEFIQDVCENVYLPLREKITTKLTAPFKNPHLWDIDDTYMYTVKTSIKLNGTVVDEYSVRFGFRYFHADPQHGFFLNGRHIKIKGVCAHQDFGLTGKAVPDNILRHKISLIKEMGANGYRCSHYPHPQATMDALDELGFIVMAETRWFESTDEGLTQLEMLIKRDRNHPSIFFWSLGNEEPYHITDEGQRILKHMYAFTKKLDSTRLITSAVSNSPELATVYGDSDVIGINYNLPEYDGIHEKYPDKPIFSSECCATGTTRGWYGDDYEKYAFLDAYDKDANDWFLGRERTWKFMMEREWIMGSYQWIAFEHRGECIWPRLCSQSGAIDLFLQKKDAFYQNQSHWIEDKPIVHLLPHWNFEGLEGEIIKVYAYTNCEETELFLNNVSMGRLSVEKYGHGEWYVPYEKGELTVIAYQNGKEAARDTRITTKRPYALKMRLENEVPQANGSDIALITCYAVDEDGNEVPDAEPFVKFSSNKLGTIVGTGSDIKDHRPVTEPDRQMRAGRISVAVRTGKNVGELKVYARAEGMKSCVLTINLAK